MTWSWCCELPLPPDVSLRSVYAHQGMHHLAVRQVFDMSVRHGDTDAAGRLLPAVSTFSPWRNACMHSGSENSAILMFENRVAACIRVLSHPVTCCVGRYKHNIVGPPSSSSSSSIRHELAVS